MRIKVWWVTYFLLEKPLLDKEGENLNYSIGRDCETRIRCLIFRVWRCTITREKFYVLLR